MIRNKNLNFIDLGKKSFLSGIFFLPTALPIAAIFLLISLFVSLFNFRINLLKDKFNFSIVTCIGLIIFSTLSNLYWNTPLETESLDKSIILINLFNWIPSLIFFIAFQIYLKKKEDRLNFARFLISGTIPVIVSCFFQLWTNYIGPFEFFNGLIVWFQKPLHITGGISGLFSNRNYAGFWLAINLPFSFLFLSENNSNSKKRFLIFLIAISLFLLAILTNSRSTLISMFFSIFIYYGLKVTVAILLTFFIVFLLNKIFPVFFSTNLVLLDYLIQSFNRLLNINFFLNAPRIVLWRSTIDYILQRPILGWGAGSFAILFLSKENFWRTPFVFFEPQHSHNLPLEMAFNFGVPISITLSSVALILFVKASIITFYKKTTTDFFNLDKAWLASCIVIFISQFNDITYYDGKINIIICILFCGLRCMIDEKKIYKLKSLKE